MVPGSSRKGRTIIAKLVSGFQGLGVGKTGNEYKDTQRNFFFLKKEVKLSLFTGSESESQSVMSDSL